MTPFVQNITNIGSFLTVVIDIFAVILFFILITPLRRSGWTGRFAAWFGDNAILLGFLVAFLATAGSLFYENIAGFAPCLLCWWQRIFLYPQALLLFIALIWRGRDSAAIAAARTLARVNSIVLSLIGVSISIYQTLLQAGAIGNDLIPCDASGVSCQHVYFINYGYVTIPAMALTAFALIILFMYAPRTHRV
jgi:disulfide bond formation protein DsbB